jgi:microcystin-dependent protein
VSSPFLSEIRIFSFGSNFAPQGWAQCNGQLLPINQNQALFSLLGTTYGGNGQTTFALPNLQGRVPLHVGEGLILGQVGGETAHTLTIGEMPAHNHSLLADATTVGTTNTPGVSGTSVLGRSAGASNPGGSFTVSMYNTAGPGGTLNPAIISNNGGSQAHLNMQPYLTLNFSIALQGIFPSRN